MRKLGWILIVAVAAMTTPFRAAQPAGPTPAAARVTEQDYDALMKKVGPVYAAMAKNLDGGEVDRVAKDAQQLAEWFGTAEKFWAQHKREDAVKWAQAAQKRAAEISTGVTAAQGYLRSDARVQSGVQERLSRARASVTNLGDICQACHAAYREGNATDGFRIKASALVR